MFSPNAGGPDPAVGLEAGPITEPCDSRRRRAVHDAHQLHLDPVVFLDEGLFAQYLGGVCKNTFENQKLFLKNILAGNIPKNLLISTMEVNK